MSTQNPQRDDPGIPPEAKGASVVTGDVPALAMPRRGLPATVRSWLPDVYMAALLVATFALDQVTKSWIRSHLLLNESLPEEGVFRITHTFNTGSAFGLFPQQTTLLMLASIGGIGILLFFLRKESVPDVWLRTSLGLQLGGAAGNLVDRITLGRVTDFIDIGVWPIFNVADASIVSGLMILAWFLLRRPKGSRGNAPKTEATPAPADPESPPHLEADGPPSGEQR